MYDRRHHDREAVGTRPRAGSKEKMNVFESWGGHWNGEGPMQVGPARLKGLVRSRVIVEAGEDGSNSKWVR